MKLTLPVILVLGMLAGMTPFAIDAYLPSIPTIARQLDTDISLIQMTLSMYLVVFALLQIVFGPISDAIGRRKVISGGLILFVIGSLVCAVSQNYEMLLVGRAIQAIGGAGVAVCVPALVKDGLSADQFVKAMSMVMLVMALAPLAAPIIGGAILTLLDWHYIFVFLALIACLGLILFRITIPETLSQEKRMPLSFKSAIKNYGILLKTPTVVGFIGAGSFHFAGMMSFITGSSFVYIELYGIEASQFGFVFGLNVICIMIASTINSRFVERVGSPTLTKWAVHAMFIAALAMLALSFIDQPPLTFIIMCGMAFMGSIGILGSGFMAGAMKHAGNNNGSVTALAGASRFSFGALSGVIISILHNGTFVPMVATMAICGILSFTCYKLVTHYSATQLNHTQE
ncbi:Bcr/CflA family multidrug efflux MFS transporter [Marinomonas epiphytica]